MLAPAAIAAAVAVLDRQSDPAVRTVADAMRAYLNGEADSLDEALGLAPAPAETADLDIRDGLIRAAAEALWPDHRPTEQARFLHGALTRYAAGPWRRERFEPCCPPGRAGTAAGFCFEIMRASPQIRSERTIRRILATGSGDGQTEPACCGQEE